MARQRVPLAKAKLTGAAAKDPQRFRDRQEPESPGLGRAPGFLNELEREAWNAFKKEWPWLAESDRAALVPLVKMRVWIETSDKLTAASFGEYRLMLQSFGGTPTTKTKIYQPKEDEPDDPFADFDGKMN